MQTAILLLLAAGSLDGPRIEALTGAKGVLDPASGVFKVSVPRNDLAVSAGGVRLTPPMGLTSWAAFQRTGEQATVMGDLVLLEDQVNPVMSAALDQGLEVTALHNHFLWETPRVMFMHVGGHGEEAALASAIGRVFTKMSETAGGKGRVPRADVDPARTTLDPKRIEGVLGVPGSLSGGVYKVVVGRTTAMHGQEMGAAMGVNTWAAFAGSDDRAVVDGDVAMQEGELQGVLKALRRADIDVVAIHHHMAGEEPRILFLHYWGVGRTSDLARGLRAALDATSPPARTAAGETVVFVCEHGSVKSLIAQEWFNRLARERGLALRAVSRGLTPDASVPPAIADALRRDGFDLGGFQPRALTARDVAGAARVIAIGADLGQLADARALKWDGIPPATQDYAGARDAIKAQIESLMEGLSARQTK